MNTLIITLGNSEVQFDKSNLGSFKLSEDNNLMKGEISIPVKPNNRIGLRKFYIPRYSRKGGKIIKENYNEFKNILKFPIVKPLINFIPKHKITNIIFVVTDQNTEIYSKGDTLYYPSIIQKYFEENGIQNISYTVEKVHEYVKDADRQYKLWGEKFSDLYSGKNSKCHYYLFAQGGIDQINQAITLQLLQKFKENVSIYQKAENEKLKKVAFAQLFLTDLTKQKIINHLADFDFARAAELVLNNSRLRKRCEDANRRLSLNHESIVNENFKKSWNEKDEICKNRQRLNDLIYSYRIDFKQKRHNDGLTKLYTIYENIFKQIIDEYAAHRTSEFYDNKKRSPNDKNIKWESFLKRYFGQEVIKRLEKRRKGIHLNNPNSMTYFYLLRFLIEDNKENRFEDGNVKKLDSILNRLRGLRNQINHSLGHAALEDIENKLGKDKISDLDSLIDKFAGTNGLVKFTNIRDNLLKEISSHEKI